jgi:hypothetical protein
MGKLVSLLEGGTTPAELWEQYAVQWSTPDGAYSMVEVKTQWDFELEGYFLAHCLGTKKSVEFNVAHRVFSLRDKLGLPHATILLQRTGVHSPYGVSRDLLTDKPVKLGLENPTSYQVLQVRGREDRIARWEYYAIVRSWYLKHGGKFPVNRPVGTVRRLVTAVQDDDLKYHYGYLLDEAVNWFDWAYWHTSRADRLAELGMVKL